MSLNNPVQLTLGVRLDDDAKFENFYVLDDNQLLIGELQREFSMLYVWGARCSGRTHLLQALCHQESAIGGPAIYIPLAEHQKFSPELLEGLPALEVICLDDIQSIVGNSDWENSLFSFFNEAKENGARMLVSANCSPKELPLNLKDLCSRFQSIPAYKLTGISDDEAIDVLKFRASRRGIELNEATAEFIYRRSSRSIDKLMKLLNKLDQASFVSRRRLTIPLVKETMGW
ncbi:MAG: DnaA regulatory inactivator Hda [Gammaproteobacteria bacterium]|nr:DnaA regulatory inactivator Hda [Gammaproteobacteria bacterium]|tara:strand:- start:2905 stop:3597 length:693 start_codon:yes stop_codon:yes gene_type:complete